MLFKTTLAKAALIILAAAPGEPEPTLNDVPHLAQVAVARRMNGADFKLQMNRIKPSDNTPGFVACGFVSDRSANQSTVKLERFFVIVPGDFAVLDRDSSALVDTYWRQNRC
jgi:hypothetical protein